MIGLFLPQFELVNKNYGNTFGKQMSTEFGVLISN